MIEMKLMLHSPRQWKAAAALLEQLAADEEAYYAAKRDLDVPCAPDEAPAPAPAAEEEKPKRGRAAKPKAEEPAKEPEPAIRATPEDRQPEPAAEEPKTVTGEVLDDKVYTRDDVKAALGAYAEKFGMAQAASEGVKLMGAPRISALPEDPAAFAAAVKALTEAVTRG